MAKSRKPFNYHYKLCSNLSSNLLSNTRGVFLKPLKKPEKMTKIFEKPEKIIIILRVCVCGTKTYRSQMFITSNFVSQKAFTNF